MRTLPYCTYLRNGRISSYKMNDDDSIVVSRDHDQNNNDNDNDNSESNITDRSDNNNDQSVQSSRKSIPLSSRTNSLPSSSRTSVVSTARKSITNNGNNSNTSIKTSTNHNNNNVKQKGINEKLSLIHENILNTLKQSNKLSPIFINVKNESYWYIQRNKIGPKKHMTLIVKYNDNKCEYETNIYKMKLRESDMEVCISIYMYMYRLDDDENNGNT